MRQKIPPTFGRIHNQPEPEPEPQPAPKPSPRLEAAREIARRARRRARALLPVVTGIFITLAALFLYNALQPADTRLTRSDVNQLVASAMASATPPPSYASQVYDIIAPSLVQIKTSTLTLDGKSESGSGSGFILDDSGTILTSLHVVTGSIDIQVLFYDNTESQASIVGQDSQNDIAVLRPRQLPAQVVPATLGDPNSLNVGDEAIVVGNPFGLRHTLTDGVISALGRTIQSTKTGVTMSNLIQFDAAVNPGNSGGPLLNRNGEVVGIVSSLLNPTNQETFIGIGFAVPIDTAAAAGGSPPY
ncbi:MAG: trypsin-like peptidase domain-containing protein [Chloroflexi bacterium]|nr:trypsin-like peptidase domain-containing protein [Chloroflexota bacterium]